MGLQFHSDGRYAGACPFPHSEEACECGAAFHGSPQTGSWHCFCSDHVGKTHGGVDALRLIGFECEQAVGGERQVQEIDIDFGAPGTASRAG